MSIFDKTLKDSSFFKNPVALDPDYTPKEVEHRENQQHYIATCINPLFQKRSGRNLLIYGSPGIGKTLAALHVLKELEETTDDIIPIYINTWQKNTPHQLLLELCSQLNYKFTQNKGTEELLEVVSQKLNKKSSVIVLDEADKIQNIEIIYQLIEKIYRKIIILITNEKNFIYNIDPRLKSRLLPDLLEFLPYSYEETNSILEKRKNLAFPSSTLDQDAFSSIVQKAYDLKDIRAGLFLLRESANIAESNSSKKITFQHAQEAINKLKNFSKPLELDREESLILNIIKQNPERTASQLFQLYKEHQGTKTERTFYRKLTILEKAKLIIKQQEGQYPKFISSQDKKLTEF